MPGMLQDDVINSGEERLVLKTHTCSPKKLPARSDDGGKQKRRPDCQVREECDRRATACLTTIFLLGFSVSPGFLACKSALNAREICLRRPRKKRR